MDTQNNPIAVIKWVKLFTVPRDGSGSIGPGVRRVSSGLFGPGMRRVTGPHTNIACNLRVSVPTPLVLDLSLQGLFPEEGGRCLEDDVSVSLVLREYPQWPQCEHWEHLSWISFQGIQCALEASESANEELCSPS